MAKGSQRRPRWERRAPIVPRVRVDTDAATTFGADHLDVTDLAAVLGTRPAAPRTVERAWYDTFDWRVWRSGRVLEVDTTSSGLEATLRDTRDHRPEWAERVDTMPQLAADLPPGPWRRTLGAVLGIRALIPVARARVVVRAMTMNADDTTTAHVLWEEMHGPSEQVSRVVRIIPVSGDDSARRTVADRLERDAGLKPSPSHPLETLLPAGHGPADYSSKSVLPLDPQMRADATARSMLIALFGVMRANEPWLFEAPDTEFLHDFRIALRRSRSVLKQAKGIMAEDARGTWRPVLRDLQQRTNVHRDLDVFLNEFDQYRALVPATFADELEPLRDLIRERRDGEHRALCEFLRSADYRRVIHEYGAFLEGPISDDATPSAARPVVDVAGERIGRAHRRLLKRGRSIDERSPAIELHGLRILGKELRYLLELYGDLYPPAPLRSLVRELRRLQDNLGQFQDSEVHVRELVAFADDLQQRPVRPSARSLMAIGLLTEVFGRQQAAARTEFEARFRAFAAKENRKRLRRLLARAPRGTDA